MSEAGQGVVHGGLQASELEALGIAPTGVLDLSASLNPRGPHASVLLAAANADVRRYPPPYAEPLRDALAERAGLPQNQVLVTPGATAAIHLAARALLGAGDACRIFPPTFGEYQAAARAAGGRVIEGAGDETAALTILCNPNNPTGEYLGRRRTGDVLASATAGGGTLLLDVAYDPFVEGAWDADDLVRDGARALVVHSMTKLQAVPGVRLGYVTGPTDLVARLTALQSSWAVSSTAIAVGLAGLRVDEQQRWATPEVTRGREELTSGLRAAGIEVRDSRANFVLVRVGDAAAFRLRLLRRGFAVRDCTSFGMPDWVRVAVPQEGALIRLGRAFVDAYAEGGG